MAEIKDCIEILRLTSTDSEKVLNAINDLGFSSYSDLELLDPETDLTDVLSVFQRRLLKRHLKNSFSKGLLYDISWFMEFFLLY